MADKTASYEVWTPEQAEKGLSKNLVNRSIREMKVDQYARDMLAGKWTAGAPITFDSEGKLIDGQHRLTAQIRADVKIEWLVQRGVDPESQSNFDIGTGRNLGDILHFGGEKNGQTLAAVAKMVHLVLKDRLRSGRYGTSIQEVIQTLDEHPDLRRSAEIALWARGKNMMTQIQPTVIGTAHWMIAQVNGDEEATAFIHRIATLTGEPEGSPVLALARRTNEIRRMQQRVAAKDWLSMVIKTWNLDAEGKKVVKIATYSKTGEYVLPKVLERKIPREDLADADEPEENEQTQEERQ
jgi:hypothetical protein